MLIIRNHGYRRKYVYGGSGIFELISNFYKQVLSDTASRAIARQAASAAKSAAKTIANKLVDKAVNKLFPSEHQKKFDDVISKYTGSAIAIQDLIRKSGLKVVY